MKKKEASKLLLLAVAITSLATLPANAADDLSLNVDSGTECVSTGQTITVTLDVASLSFAINGVQVRLHYDNTLMTLVDIVPTDLFGGSPPGWVEISQSDASGDIDWAAVIQGGQVLFNNNIATLTFTAIADGTATVTFRPDSPPFETKLTKASDSTTIFPVVYDTDLDFDGDSVGDAFIGPPDCTITADDPVCDGATGNAASVPDAGVGATYDWVVTGGTITGGAGTDTIAYTGTNPTSITIDVTVTDINGCSSSCQTIVSVDPTPTADAGADATLCADAADPTVGGAPTASGGVGPYTYAWTGSGAAYLDSVITANPVFDVLTAGPGSYQACVTVTDANTCASATDCATVTIDALPVADAGADATLCSDAADPTVGGAPTASGGLGPYTYSWTGAGAVYLSSTTAANPTLDILTAGAGAHTVCVTVTDSNTCVSVIDCATITINDVPVADAGSDFALCANAPDPTVGGVPTASGGLGPYTYSWTGTGAVFLSSAIIANPTFDVLSAGVGVHDICVTVTDANSCVSTTDCAVITVNLVLDCTITTANPVCAGTVNGAIVGSAGGGATYDWTVTGGTQDTLDGVNTLTYTAGAGPTVTIDITVTDINSCTNTCQTIVTVNDNPTADAGADLTRCANEADPAVGGAPTATGGTGPYTYAWTGAGAVYLSDTAAANPTFDLATAGPGSYQVCVTINDSNTCISATDCATVTIDDVPLADAGGDFAICADAADPVVGGAPTGSGGLGPYTYSWTGTGAIYLSSIIVANPTFDMVSAGPGMHQVCVTVTDTNTCVTATDCAMVTVDDLPVADAGAGATLCADAADPTVGGAPTASGATGPYAYAWTGSGAAFLDSVITANPVFDVLTAGPGSYQACVTVTDANTCVSVTDCATVTIDALPVADAGADATLCSDAADPAVGGAPTASGGLGPYTYSWSGAGAVYLSSTTVANPTLDILTAGAGAHTVCVTVTDSNTCVSATDCATITINDVPLADAGSDFALCANAPDPTVGGAPTATGGLGPYTYSWTGTGSVYLSSTIVANPTFDVLTAGVGVHDICVTVTDANTCVSTTDCATVTVNLVLDCTITTADPVCAGTVNGALVGSAGGGATYDWTVTGGTQDTADDVNTLTYTAGAGPTVTIDITVTDINSCTNTCQTIVTVNDNPTADAGADVALCADAVDPAVGGAPTATGGTGPYTYAWTGAGAVYLSDTAAANPTLDVLTAGPGAHTVCVTVNDTNSCVSSTDCATVTINALPLADAGGDITLCADAADPAVGGAPTASGGLGPYTYSWTGSGAVYLSSTIAANPTFAVLTAGPGTHQVCVTVTDSNACISVTDCSIVTIDALPVADAGADITVCADAAGQAVGGAPTALGGVGPYTYVWSGSAAAFLDSTTTTNPTFDVATAGPGSYQACVTVTDSNSCASVVDCTTVTVNALSDCTVTAENLICAGTGGHIASVPDAGVGSTYSWIVTGGTIDSGDGTTSINYTAGSGTSLTIDITVTDPNGCISTCQKIVTVDAPDCTISGASSVCYLSVNNFASVPSAGGGATYFWTVTGTGASLTGGQATNSITYDAGSGASVTLVVTVTNANGCISTCQKIITIIQPSIDVTLELEAVSNVVTRDITFVITDCPGTTDQRVLPVTTDALGVGTVNISGTSPSAEWISVQEGHTLKKLAAVTYGVCSAAAVDLTGAGRLLAGDFHTVSVPQDNLCDITDFSILASAWNVPIDANLTTGGDATGDGTQGTADFTAIQVNFFTIGETDDSCSGGAVIDDGLVDIIAIDPGDVITTSSKIARSSIRVDSLTFPNAKRADLTGDGVIDARDIRAFARRYGLTLLPEFSRKLDKMSGRKGRTGRGR